MGTEMALREMGSVTLGEALDYVALIAERRPRDGGSATGLWHGRLEIGVTTSSDAWPTAVRWF